MGGKALDKSLFGLWVEDQLFEAERDPQWLAQMIGISSRHIRRYLQQGEVKLTLPMLLRIVVILATERRVDASYLLIDCIQAITIHWRGEDVTRY